MIWHIVWKYLPPLFYMLCIPPILTSKGGKFCHALERKKKNQEDSLMGVAGFFKYFLTASHLTSFNQEEGTHKAIFASRDQRRHGSGCKKVWVFCWNYWDIQEISSLPCEGLTPGIASRGSLCLKCLIFSHRNNLLTKFYFHAPRCFLGVFYSKSTVCLSKPKLIFCSCNWSVPN